MLLGMPIKGLQFLALCANIAQLVEHCTHTTMAAGSSPVISIGMYVY